MHTFCETLCEKDNIFSCACHVGSFRKTVKNVLNKHFFTHLVWVVQADFFNNSALRVYNVKFS